MTFLELIRNVSQETGQTQSLTEGIIRTAFAEIQRELLNGERVTLSDFGILTAKRYAARRVRPPRGTGAVIIPAKIKIHFKPGIKFRHELTAKATA